MAEHDEETDSYHQHKVVTPHPDPTVLTTAQLYREIGTINDKIAARIGALDDVISTRLDGMDTALQLLQVRSDRIPTETDKSVDQLKNVIDERLVSISVQTTEKFHSMVMQIEELRSRLEASYTESRTAVATALQAAEKAVATALTAQKEAVAAALTAQKEAVSEQNKSFALATAKSEATTTKQIDQIGALINATVNALNDKIDDIKGRLTTIEGSGKGSKDLMAIIFTIAGICIAAIAAFIAFSKAG